jgi:hypothetical protein
MGEHNGATAAFAAALRTAGAALAEVPGLLEDARVHEAAFGKLFEAAEVREAYHQRLPETEDDVAEALEVIAHFVAGLEGGHPIGARERDAGAESSSAAPAAPAAEAVADASADLGDPAGLLPRQQRGGPES